MASSTAAAGFDRGAVFPFGGHHIFLLLRNPAFEIVGFGRIECGKHLDLGFGFVASATNDSRRFQIEFTQIAAGIHVVGIQPDRSLELGPYFAGKRRRAEKIGTVRLLTVNPAQPHVITAVVGFERNRLFARRNAAVPIAHREVGAAKEVISLGIVRRGVDLGVQRGDGVIRSSRSQQRGSGIVSRRQCRAGEERQDQNQISCFHAS